MQAKLVVVVFLGALACAAPQTRAAGAYDVDGQWSRAELEKLEPELRTQVRDAEGERFAVSVLFLELPTDEELEALSLDRLGERVIGNVGAETLRVLASREDVERIELLDDVGYETL